MMISKETKIHVMILYFYLTTKKKKRKRKPTMRACYVVRRNPASKNFTQMILIRLNIKLLQFIMAEQASLCIHFLVFI